MRDLVIGITGASGIRYAIRLLEEIARLKKKDNRHVSRVSIVYTDAACKVAELEMQISNLGDYLRTRYGDTITVYSAKEITAPIASSSNMVRTDVVIVPCTLNTLAKLGSGIEDNLLTRAAMNALRLRNKLILVIRETPVSFIDVLNMAKLSLAGAIIMPASPGFYSSPRGLSDIENFIVGKILDLLGISHSTYRRWTS